jgi:hypothetical protein
MLIVCGNDKLNIHYKKGGSTGYIEPPFFIMENQHVLLFFADYAI